MKKLNNGFSFVVQTFPGIRRYSQMMNKVFRVALPVYYLTETNIYREENYENLKIRHSSRSGI